jgi:hypothetical protein
MSLGRKSGSRIPMHDKLSIAHRARTYIVVSQLAVW